MKNSSECEEKLLRISQHPPPYTVENTGSVHHIHRLAIPDVHLVLSNATGNISSDSLDLFIKSLGRFKRFTMVRKDRLGCINKTIIIQIRDATKRPIFSVLKIPGRNIPGTNNSLKKITSVIQMTNSFGQTLLTGVEGDEFITVFSGEQLIGTIKWSLSRSLNLTVESIIGEPLFESVEECGANGSAFSSSRCYSFTPFKLSFVSNGVTLGHVKKSTNNSNTCEITLVSSRHLDSRTKALLIFTGYVIFYNFTEGIPFGNIEASGLCQALQRLWY